MYRVAAHTHSFVNGGLAWNFYALTRCREFHAVVATPNAVRLDGSFGQWRHAVAATVLKRRYAAVGRAKQHHPLAQYGAGQRLIVQLSCKSSNVPSVFNLSGHRGTATVKVKVRFYDSLMTGLTSVPTPSTLISQVSPCFIHTGGSRRAPTPPGVPQAITSPGTSGQKVET